MEALGPKCNERSSTLTPRMRRAPVKQNRGSSKVLRSVVLLRPVVPCGGKPGMAVIGCMIF
jgi:hypothetical protein